ncbi:MAG: nucleoside triphosphate pyrophosphohydrolase [Deltaproteobacteria bacterium]|nr:nucleoside triphosphate pyrophosphohydrolase [Deltaproteobacteria bacterium]
MPDEHDPPIDRIASALAGAAGIVRRLRAPGGCPWDREQTPSTLKPFIVEEAYEVLDAIDGGNPDELREELGDLLLQILLQAEIARESGAFDIADVAEGLSRKLVHRHPHVFGEATVQGSDQVLVNWEKIKKKEKEGRGLFDGLPASLPALLRAARMGEKAGRVGFDWPNVQGVRAKIDEELAEVDEAARNGVHEDVEHELGDVLFAVAQWARHLGCQPEESLRACCARFTRRFAGMERILAGRGRPMTECSIDEMETAWQEAKRQ